MDAEIAQGITAQVHRHVDELTPRFQALLNTLEDEFDLSSKRTPIAIRLMVYEIIFSDLLARMVVSGATTFSHPLEKAIEGVVVNLKKMIAAHHKDLGEHNVHANSVGEKLPSDKPNS